jgi:hypothetical protein
MVGITERNQQKKELVDAGFSLKYIDEWVPKTTLYRHRASYNVEGKISGGVGTAVKGVPGNPDYVLRKKKIGLFPWIPSESCDCKWCAERNRAVDLEPVQVEEVKGTDETQSAGENTAICPNCDIVISAKSGAGALSRLRAHIRMTHNQ